jgi:hypothetical protein
MYAASIVANGDELDRTVLARMQALGHIRLAHGVVGKASVVAGIVLLALGAIAMRVDSDLLLVMAGVVVLVFFVYLAAMLWFAHRHPEQPSWKGPRSSNIVNWSWRRGASQRWRKRHEQDNAPYRRSCRRINESQGLLRWYQMGAGWSSRQSGRGDARSAWRLGEVQRFYVVSLDQPFPDGSRRRAAKNTYARCDRAGDRARPEGAFRLGTTMDLGLD